MKTKAYKYVGFFLCIILCALFADAFTKRHLLNKYYNDPVFSFDAALEHEAVAPFANRLLIPEFIRAIYPHVNPILQLSSPWGYMRLIETLCVIAILFFNYYLVRSYTNCIVAQLYGLILSCVALLTTYILPKGLNAYYWYDIPSIMFFSASLFLAVNKRFVLYYIVFAFATVNKETSCFITVAFLIINAKNRDILFLLKHLSAQFTLWLLIKLSLPILYAPDGTAFWWTFPRNLSALQSIDNISKLLSTMGCLPIIVALGWRSISHPLAKALCLLSPLYFVGMLFVGYVEEIRIYGELLPILVPAGALILANGQGSEQVAALVHEARSGPRAGAP